MSVPLQVVRYGYQVEWSWTTWLISVAAVVISGLAAWLEGSWTERAGLEMGFANHGGMWGDLLLLPVANAVIVPHLTVGPWIAGALMASTVASVWVHTHWYHGRRGPTVTHSPEYESAPESDTTRVSEEGVWQTGVGDTRKGGDHMWPSRPQETWWRDLSWSGWAHVVYVIGELSLLVGFLLHAIPTDVILCVTALFTIHVPIGLLQPRYFLTGRVATTTEQPLLVPLLLALWAVSLVKIVGIDRLAG